MAASKKSSASTARKPRVKVDPNETREQKFARLANKRVNTVLKHIALVGNLASYPHSPEQGERIVSAIQEYVDALSVKMAPRTPSGKSAFTL